MRLLFTLMLLSQPWGARADANELLIWLRFNETSGSTFKVRERERGMCDGVWWSPDTHIEKDTSRDSQRCIHPCSPRDCLHWQDYSSYGASATGTGISTYNPPQLAATTSFITLPTSFATNFKAVTAYTISWWFRFTTVGGPRGWLDLMGKGCLLSTRFSELI
jgi:hypothetical protein